MMSVRLQAPAPRRSWPVMLYQRVALPFYESVLRGRRTVRYWRDLEQSQWWSPERLVAHQTDALSDLLAHANSASPYYRALWQRKGLHPRDVQTLADLRQFPLITRTEIAANRGAMRAMRALIAKSTGGSSGEPLHFDLNHDSNDRREAACMRGYGFAGAPPGTRQWHLWGVPLTGLSRWRAAKLHAYYRIQRRHLVNSFTLSDATVPALFGSYNRYRPDVIVAYTTPLFEFARAVEERGLRPHQPQSIVVGAEKLHDFQREVIERVFGAPVHETYGSREFMLIAGECDRRQGLHLTMEHLLVEVVDEHGRAAAPGEEGQVVVTDLFNYGLPFIRYVTGDRAIAGFGSCGCGRGLPVLRKVCGRELDVVTTPDGRLVPGEFFPFLLRSYHPAVRQYQVVQEDALTLVLSVVTGASWTGSHRQRLESDVKDAVGPSMRVVVQETRVIPLTPTGKLRVVINRAQRPTKSP